jgi:thiamine kinase-like enzyme
MNNIKRILINEIKRVLGVNINDKELKKIRKASNYVYSFSVDNQKYFIRKFYEGNINNWENEKAAYNVLKLLNITDKLVSYENGIKISEFLDGEKIRNCETDIIDAINELRKVHQSGASIEYEYDIIGNMEKYIEKCGNVSSELKNRIEADIDRNKINKIQTLVNKMNIPKVLCHGDACLYDANFLRLSSDKSIKIIDWEHAGMADPMHDIATTVLNLSFNNVPPVWYLHQYLKRSPDRQEYRRLFCYLALDSYRLMAWFLLEEDEENYNYFLNFAGKYTELVLDYYGGDD